MIESSDIVEIEREMAVAVEDSACSVMELWKAARECQLCHTGEACKRRTLCQNGLIEERW
jgi:hypothetical protein